MVIGLVVCLSINSRTTTPDGGGGAGAVFYTVCFWFEVVPGYNKTFYERDKIINMLT